MKNFKSIILFLSLLIILLGCSKKKNNQFLGVFVDSLTYENTNGAVDKYCSAVNNDGMQTKLFVKKWQSPEDIKKIIVDLHDEINLQSVVFIGDIPIPMIRDAQHLTSAFKIDQRRFTLERTSVPSDRFYDDFDLKFDFIKQDTTNTLLFYYSLSHKSPQYVKKNIYSGRIKSPTTDSSKYEIIEKYLLKVSEQKSKQEKLDNVLTYLGHGYVSESLAAKENLSFFLREQFPQLFYSSGRIKSYFHSMDNNMKKIILNELQKEELDMAIFHAHGGADTQYLLGYPTSSSIGQNVEAIKLFLRSKMRYAKRRKKSVAEYKNHYMETYNIPEKWFEGAFDDSMIIVDSLYSAKLDIYSDDVNDISPQAKLIIFDQCYNGAFIKSPYIAGNYVFGNGKTIVGIANSVNVKQNIWCNELLGILNYGVRIGEWHKFNNYLESHIIGDPTFHFLNSNGINLSKLLSKNNKQSFKKLLNNNDPVLRTLAIKKIFDLEKEKFESKLIDIYNTDISFNVRTETLKCMANIHSEKFEKILFTSINDPSEYIRRMSAIWMGEIGKEKYLQPLIETIFNDHSKRVTFSAKNSLAFMCTDSIVHEQCMAYVEKLPKSIQNKGSKYINHLYKNSRGRANDLIVTIQDKNLSDKKRISSIRTFRSYKYFQFITKLLEIVKDSEEKEKVRLAIIEALGWYSFSENSEFIISELGKINENITDTTKINLEIERTIKRLTSYPNNSLSF
ncbi:MAG: HEAT repeat domain-containing protein [Candidatus Marinimicrobia bacterium]|nr:HEAT repeat domain-containing protein [Candidatus Neomarinimicrobiota bacterium]